MSLIDFFKPDLYSTVDLSRADNLYAVAITDSPRAGMGYDIDAMNWATDNPQHELWICRLAPEMYVKSDVCRKLAKVVSVRDLADVGIDISKVGESMYIGDRFTHMPSYCMNSGTASGTSSGTASGTDRGTSKLVYFITFLTKPIDISLLTMQTVPDIRSFLTFARFADYYCLNMQYICSNPGFTFWLSAIRERQKDIWRANDILLTNIEQKYYGPKFRAAGVVEAYPVGNVTVPKMVNLIAQVTHDMISGVELRELFTILNRYGCTSTVMKLLTSLGSSIQYCDTIFGSSEVLSMRGLIIPQSLVFYAFRILYLEELAMYNRKRTPGRFILDIESASVLPIYTNIGIKSPYLVTIARSVLNESRSLLIPSNFTGVRKIATLKQFKERFATYTFGLLDEIGWSGSIAVSTECVDTESKEPISTENVDAADVDAESIENIDGWTVRTRNFRIAFNGSGICACAIINPLENAFDTFSEYVEEYYPSRKNIRPASVISYEETQTTMCAYESDSDSDSQQCIVNERDGIAARAEFDNPSYDYSDIDLMIECNMDDFDTIANVVYQQIKSRHAVEMIKVKTENKHKYTVAGGNRTIDLFHVDNIEAVVVKYHLPCVRAWYDGATVKMLPSFVTAAMTGINMDMRWTSNRKDLRDTVLKYFQRGFATILCREDKLSLLHYINSDDSDDEGGGDEGGDIVTRKHSWPKHETPDDQYEWKIQRFRKLPIFAKCSRDLLFNPSISRIGIHQSIDTLPQRANLQAILTGLKSRSKKETPDYKLASGRVELPFMCKSLGTYM